MTSDDDLLPQSEKARAIVLALATLRQARTAELAARQTNKQTNMLNYPEAPRPHVVSLSEVPRFTDLPLDEQRRILKRLNASAWRTSANRQRSPRPSLIYPELHL